MTFYDWFLSLSVMSSRSIHVTCIICTSFLFMAKSYSIVWTDHLFVHSSVDGHFTF